MLTLRFDISLWGMVQLHMAKGNTFQAGSMATNTYNSLSKQELRTKSQLAGLRKVLPSSEPCRLWGEKRPAHRATLRHVRPLARKSALRYSHSR